MALLFSSSSPPSKPVKTCCIGKLLLAQPFQRRSLRGSLDRSACQRFSCSASDCKAASSQRAVGAGDHDRAKCHGMTVPSQGTLAGGCKGKQHKGMFMVQLRFVVPQDTLAQNQYFIQTELECHSQQLHLLAQCRPDRPLPQQKDVCKILAFPTRVRTP